jgi:hypothetical protein
VVAFAVVDMLVELVVAVNIVDFVAFVGVVVVEYLAAADFVAENFVVTNIAETVMVPFVEPVTFVAATSVAVKSVVVTSEVVRLEAVTFGVVTFGVVAIGVVTIVGEQCVDILLVLAQQLIDLNLELIYLKSCAADSTLTPSSILDLSEFDLQALDQPHAV